MQNFTVKGYILSQKLGAGGMAEVWLAENEIGKPAAVKILRKDLSFNEDVVNRFKNEAKVMVTLNHPNIRQVYDYGELDGRPCIIMEYLDGSDLSARLKNGERFTDAQLRDWWNQLVEALAYTHARGVVHRDIKPSNIFLTSDGKVKLLDFGIAKVKGGITATQTGTRMGTLMYMSPEQVKDSKYVDYRSDIYSLGVTFYHLVTGRAPYESNTNSDFEIQVKIVNEPLDLTKLSANWQNVLEPYLQKEPSERTDLGTITQNNWIMHFSKSNPHDLSKTIPSAENTFVKQNSKRPPLPNYVGIDWVDIPGGTFYMGSPYDEFDRKSDETQHLVRLDSFKMSKFQITFAQFDIFCNATGRQLLNDEGWGRGNRPVINIKWRDAMAFANWMDCQLPTEAEWEYACRAGAKTPFNTGNCLNVAQANYDGKFPYKNCSSGSCTGKTLPVGSFAPNAWGLYDMHGNVWEWCLDWYGEYQLASQINPQGANLASNRVLRGGSWRSTASFCRCAFRYHDIPGSLNNVGIRLVKRVVSR